MAGDLDKGTFHQGYHFMDDRQEGSSTRSVTASVQPIRGNFRTIRNLSAAMPTREQTENIITMRESVD